MVSQRPYLIQALFDWIVDSQCTPYIIVNTKIPHVLVPQEHIDKQGQIVLNISPFIVKELHINKKDISFKARFSGIERDIYIPIQAIIAIYAKENSQGMIFDEEDVSDDSSSDKDFLKIIK